MTEPTYGNYGNWTTDNEIAYINSLWHGTYPRINPIPADPVMLLRNYIKSAQKRVWWNTFGDVNGRRVIAHARLLVEESI